MDYLIEIGTEELPAGTTGEIANNFQTLFLNKLSEFGITPQPPYKGEPKASKQDSINIQLFSTPRRIALLVIGLPGQTEAKEELVKGPAPTAPAQAIEGFAKKNQIAKEGLEVIEGRLCFKKKIQPIKIQEVLQQSLEHATSSLSGEKWMTWADGEFNFSRPVRWLVSLLDSEIFPIKLFGLTADRKTRVNRLLEAESQNNVKFVEIDSAQNYVQILRSDKCLVEPLREERKKRILQQIDAIKKEEKFNVGVKDELVEEVIDLLEWPTALVGEFEEEFLKLPGFLIATVLSHHQRYFYCFNSSTDPVRDPIYALSTGLEANLSNQFIFIAQCKAEAQETVIKGNERVLRARLKDAEFFVQEDLKIPLIERKEKLKKMTFQKDLGEGKSTMFDKVERLVKFADEWEDFNPQARKFYKSVFEISKSDLASNLVFEFPELQGQVGGFLADKEIKSAWTNQENRIEAAKAIYEQYLTSANNQRPKSFMGAKLSVVDKIDNLVSIFSIGKLPTGSSDPYALRRQTQDIFKIMLDGYLALQFSDVSIEKLFNISYKVLKGKNEGFEEFFYGSKNLSGLADFLLQRLIFVLVDEFSKEFLDGVITNKELLAKPFLEIYFNIKSLNFLISRDFHVKTLSSIRRVSGILKNWQPKDFSYYKISLCNVEVEENLNKAILKWNEILLEIPKNKITSYGGGDLEDLENFLKKWESLTELQKPIDEFFEGVMVEDPNPEIAHNRKALLYSLKQKLDDVFFAPDWDKLVQYMEEKTKS